MEINNNSNHYHYFITILQYFQSVLLEMFLFSKKVYFFILHEYSLILQNNTSISIYLIIKIDIRV